jgi:hypothetical protein
MKPHTEQLPASSSGTHNSRDQGIPLLSAAMANCPTQKLLLLSRPKLGSGWYPTGWQLPTVPSGCKDTVERQCQAF